MKTMVDIILTIPTDKVERLRTAILYIMPIPLDENNDPMYTEMQWIKIILRRYLIGLVLQGERKIAFNELNVVKDESLVE